MSKLRTYFLDLFDAISDILEVLRDLSYVFLDLFDILFDTRDILLDLSDIFTDFSEGIFISIHTHLDEYREIDRLERQKRREYEEDLIKRSSEKEK